MTFSKIGKRTWILLAAAIVVVSLGSLGMIRIQQDSEQKQLAEQLVLAKQKLNMVQLEQVTAQKEQLDKKLGELDSQIEAAQIKLSTTNDSITASGGLLNLAKACEVRITDMTSSGWGSDTSLGVGSPGLSISLKVEGAPPNLVNFAIELRNTFPTGVVKSLKMEVPESAAESAAGSEADSGAESEAPKQPSADIRLIIYNYRGS